MGNQISFLDLVAPNYWQELELNEVLALNEIGYCENTSVSFREMLVSVSQETNSFL